MSNDKLNLITESILAGISDIIYKNRYTRYPWMNSYEVAAYNVGVTIAKKALEPGDAKK